jgi:Arc/MetJ-type ribon-helix-helix transcriptional regulator
MHNTSVTVRIPDSYLGIIDSFVQKKGLSRSDLFRKSIINLAKNIQETEYKNKLTEASKKVSKNSSKENLLFNNMLSDGLENE